MAHKEVTSDFPNPSHPFEAMTLKLSASEETCTMLLKPVIRGDLWNQPALRSLWNQPALREFVHIFGSRFVVA